MSNAQDENGYRNLAVNHLRPNEIRWALNHNAVHGIAYAFSNPLAVAEASEDPGDDRQTYLVRIKRDDLAKAMTNINQWITDHPGSGGIAAFGFLRALSREGAVDRIVDDDDRR